MVAAEATVVEADTGKIFKVDCQKQKARTASAGGLFA
jgi:hypothetical protein